MVLQYLAAQGGGVKMGVNLGSLYAFVTQQSLYHAQVCTTFEQSCGKRVAQGVGTHYLCYAGFNGDA